MAAEILAWLVQGTGLGLAAAAQPGPLQAFLIGQALDKGWRRTLPAVLAPLISDGPIVALALFVLQRVPASLEQFLYIAGGIFVLFLAWQAFRAWRRFAPQPSDERTPTAGTVMRAALMNLLSPGPYLYWSLAAGPLFLSAWREARPHGVGFIMGFYLAMIAGSALIVVVFAMARRLGPRINRAMLGLSALVLAGFGLRQLWLGISAWLA
ncbi:MAG: LysE family transporter [Anaerolineales bacterium]|nr:LysE family transporter [Anaerolineales bacterium]